MNKTPKLRFKEFSGDWESKKLGNVAKIVGGGTPSTTESEYWNGNIPWFTPTEIKSQKFVSMSERTITEVGLKKSSAKILPKGTVLLTTRASLGDMAIANQEVTTNQGFQSIIAGSDISNEFIYYLQPKLKKYCYKNASGSTFLEISKSNIEQFKFNMPLKEEQEKIASFFSLIDDKISLQGEKVEALKDYKKGMMQKIFSRELRFKDDDGRDYPEWEEKKLGDLVETITDYVAAGSFESIRNNVKYIETPNHAQLVRTVDLKHKFNNKNFVYVDENAFDFLYRVNLNKECTILPNIGANIGESYFIKPESLPYKFNVLAPNAILLRSDKNNNRYIYYLLNTRIFHKQLDCMVGASGQPKFNKTELKQMRFKIASLCEQNKICRILEGIDLKIEKEQEKLDSLNEYKKGLLQQMFI
ncbi:MAG: restriction endonuclease subunit S [Clostridium sp.]